MREICALEATGGNRSQGGFEPSPGLPYLWEIQRMFPTVRYCSLLFPTVPYSPLQTPTVPYCKI